MKEQIRILIIAPPGRISDSLRVLLRARRGITVAGQASGVVSGLRLVAEVLPSVVVLYTGLEDGDTWQLLCQVAQSWPQIHCCVLAHNSTEERLARQCGAHAVLQVGFTAENLYRVVESLGAENQAC